MKKALFLVCLVLTVMLASCGYSKEDLIRAENEGYKAGFEEGYDLAKYEASGELERYDHYMDGAYEAGYEAGYEDGYSDGLEGEDNKSYHGSGVIKKDR